MRNIALEIAGMTCAHCLQAVNDALASQPGVRLESLRLGRAVLSYDEERTGPAAIEAVIAEAGYTATTVPSDAGEGGARV